MVMMVVVMVVSGDSGHGGGVGLTTNIVMSLSLSVVGWGELLQMSLSLTVAVVGETFWMTDGCHHHGLGMAVIVVRDNDGVSGGGHTR